MSKQNFVQVAGIAAAIVVFLALVDAYFFMKFQPNLSGIDQIIHLGEFWIFAFAMIIVLAMTYYFLVEDLSETVALALTSLVLVFTGWEDIIFYFVKGLPLLNPMATLPWLDTHPIIGTISNTLHGALPTTFVGVGVTGATLIASAFIGIGVLAIAIPLLLEVD